MVALHVMPRFVNFGVQTIEIHAPHYHTLARYYESVVRATKQVNGESQNLNPRHAQTP